MDQILHAGLPHCTAIGYPPHGETTHSTPRPGEIEDEIVDAEADPSLGPEIAGRGCCLARRQARSGDRLTIATCAGTGSVCPRSASAKTPNKLQDFRQEIRGQTLTDSKGAAPR